jgi:peptide/nickel transport system substrate-binding protein
VRSVEIDGAPPRLRINLTRPDSFLLTDLANVPLPHPENQAVGLGPYKRTSDSATRLEAFGDYYRGRPSIDVVSVEEFGEARTSWAALMRGQLDAVHEIAPEAIDFIQAEGQTLVRTFSFTRPYFISLFFNVRHPILKNPKVRQALSYGVDRQAIIDFAMNGQGVVAEGPIWPFHWSYSAAGKLYSKNIEAATLRLDAAGLREKPASAGRMPSRFRFRCLTLANDTRYEKIALVLQKQLFEIGVDMEIESAPMSNLIGRMQSGQFDAMLVERTSGRALAWTYFFFHSSLMSAGYSAADAILDRLRKATDDGDVRKGVGDFQQILYDDPPAIFIAWPQVARVVSSRFQVPEEKGRDVMSSLWLWKPAELRR